MSMHRLVLTKSVDDNSSLAAWPGEQDCSSKQDFLRVLPNQAPRILTVINSFDPGGVERVALRLNAAWRRMGIAARVVAGRASGSAATRPDTIDQSAEIRILPEESGPGLRSPLLRMLRALPGIIREERPDLIFCPGNTYTLVAVALKLVLGRQCPPIIAKISNDLHRRDMTPVLRFFYHRWLWLQGRWIDRFVAIAPAMATEIQQLMQVPANRISVINNPVLSNDELHGYAKLARIPALNGRRFIAIGRLVPQKNFILLVDAFAKIARPDDRLTILGEGPERAAIEQRAAHLGIADRLVMPGHVADVRNRLANADVFCMSSNFEGIPAGLIEAMAAGLAIVATDCSAGMADLTGHGRFGTLVPVGDVTALAGAMDGVGPGQSQYAEAFDHLRSYTLEAGARAYIALGLELTEREPVRRLALA